jgi:hypothetical protein
VPPTKQHEDDRPITAGAVVKWGGLVATALSLIVGGVWQIADLRSQNAVQDRDISTNSTQIVELKRKTDMTNDSLTDIKTQLARQTAILERVEQRVGK